MQARILIPILCFAFIMTSYVGVNAQTDPTCVTTQDPSCVVPEAPPAPDAPEAPQASVPIGAVMWFDADVCPPGWSPYAPAMGRAIVGTSTNGTVGGVVGDSLDDLENQTHSHEVDVERTTTNVDQHNHVWARYTSSESWYSGDGQFMINWGNGLDAAGVGTYPIAVEFANRNVAYSTSGDSHAHTVDPDQVDSSEGNGALPYVQLLACRANDIAAPEVPANSDAVPSEVAEQLRALETENAELEKRLAALEALVSALTPATT